MNLKQLKKIIREEIDNVRSNKKDYPDSGVTAKLKLTNKNLNEILKQAGIDTNSFEHDSGRIYDTITTSSSKIDMKPFVDYIRKNFTVSDITSFINEDKSWIFLPDGWTSITKTPYPKLFAEALINSKLFFISDIINLYYGGLAAGKPTNPEPGVKEMFIDKFLSDPDRYGLDVYVDNYEYIKREYPNLPNDDVKFFKILFKNTTQIEPIVKKLYPDIYQDMKKYIK